MTPDVATRLLSNALDSHSDDDEFVYRYAPKREVYRLPIRSVTRRVPVYGWLDSIDTHEAEEKNQD